jgi:hypothetical protein
MSHAFFASMIAHDYYVENIKPENYEVVRSLASALVDESYFPMRIVEGNYSSHPSAEDPSTIEHRISHTYAIIYAYTTAATRIYHYINTSTDCMSTYYRSVDDVIFDAVMEADAMPNIPNEYKAVTINQTSGPTETVDWVDLMIKKSEVNPFLERCGFLPGQEVTVVLVYDPVAGRDFSHLHHCLTNFLGSIH